MSLRSDYVAVERMQTRWADNDIYGHVNNVAHYAFFDTLINTWLIREGGLDIHAGPVIGICAESSCTYRESLAFPGEIDGALRVGHLGRSSVRYELALFAADAETAASIGTFVHVFVDRETRRPVPIAGRLRECLARLDLTAS
jgi:acyl-CoA thioester hydrolase